MREKEQVGCIFHLIHDVARAVFEALARRNICVGIPEEDLSAEDKRHDKAGHLRLSLYVTRDAAMGWQEEAARELKHMGSKEERKSFDCTSTRQWGLSTFLHGDKFTTAWSREEVK